MLKKYAPRIALHQSHYMMWAELCACLLLISAPALAEGGCPSGYAPSGVGPGGVQGCAPLTGSNSGNTQQAAVWKDRYGALATDDKLGKLGTSTDLDSRRKAESAALSDCQAQGGTQCKLEAWHRNGCTAMVVGHTGHVTETAADQDSAVQKAMKTCQADGDPACHIYYTACSSPQRVR